MGEGRETGRRPKTKDPIRNQGDKNRRDTGNAAQRTWTSIEAPGLREEGYQRHAGGRRDPLVH